MEMQLLASEQLHCLNWVIDYIWFTKDLLVISTGALFLLKLVKQ